MQEQVHPAVVETSMLGLHCTNVHVLMGIAHISIYNMKEDINVLNAQHIFAKHALISHNLTELNVEIMIFQSITKVEVTKCCVSTASNQHVMVKVSQMMRS